jgi:MYXO-CTERM domain-containing protein
MSAIRRAFAFIVSVGLFLFLTYVFTLFFEPQGQDGWVTALILIGVSGIGCVLLYAWIAKPGRKLRSREPDDSDPGALGLGLTGLGVGARRRRDDVEPDNLGGRRRDRDSDGETDGDLSEMG